jgi:hypothetical protein
MIKQDVSGWATSLFQMEPEKKIMFLKFFCDQAAGALYYAATNHSE